VFIVHKEFYPAVLKLIRIAKSLTEKRNVLAGGISNFFNKSRQRAKNHRTYMYSTKQVQDLLKILYIQRNFIPFYSQGQLDTGNSE